MRQVKGGRTRHDARIVAHLKKFFRGLAGGSRSGCLLSLNAALWQACRVMPQNLASSDTPLVKSKPKRPPKLMIGWREMITFPNWGLLGVRSKTDTGARTTALHARDVAEYEQDGVSWVSFLCDHDALGPSEPIHAKVLHRRNITNTSGVPEARYIVTTVVQIGPRQARVEISLADRGDMGFPVILGRTAMRQLRLTVDPGRSWLQSDKPKKKRNRA